MIRMIIDITQSKITEDITSTVELKTEEDNATQLESLQSMLIALSVKEGIEAVAQRFCKQVTHIDGGASEKTMEEMCNSTGVETISQRNARLKAKRK